MIADIIIKPFENGQLMDHSLFKWVSLLVLIVQTTALVLLLRYSRTQVVEGPRYLSSTAVFVSEVVKLITCIFVLLKNHSLLNFLLSLKLKPNFLIFRLGFTPILPRARFKYL
jgi:hypothetical protein